jgi:hypothetical protein
MLRFNPFAPNPNRPVRRALRGALVYVARYGVWVTPAVAAALSR